VRWGIPGIRHLTLLPSLPRRVPSLSPPRGGEGGRWAAGARAFLLALALACGVGAPAAAAEGGASPGPIAARFGGEATEAEELIFELRLNNLVLAEAFPALLRGSTLLLPLGDLARALEFSIREDTRAGRADGWFLRESRLFSLDAGRREVVLDGLPVAVEPGMMEVRPDGIYVDIRLLARWFPVDFSFDTANLIAFILSREPLPVEERLARGLYRQRAFAGRQGKRDYPRVESPRRWAPPVLDLSAELSSRRDPEAAPARRCATAA